MVTPCFWTSSIRSSKVASSGSAPMASAWLKAPVSSTVSIEPAFLACSTTATTGAIASQPVVGSGGRSASATAFPPLAVLPALGLVAALGLAAGFAALAGVAAAFGLVDFFDFEADVAAAVAGGAAFASLLGVVLALATVPPGSVGTRSVGRRAPTERHA